jgi:hypothetical protein
MPFVDQNLGEELNGQIYELLDQFHVEILHIQVQHTMHQLQLSFQDHNQEKINHHYIDFNGKLERSFL